MNTAENLKSKLPAFAPLATCMVGFGWFMLLVLPDRQFTGLGYVAFLLVAAGGIGFSTLSVAFLFHRSSFPKETTGEMATGFILVFLFTAILFIPIIDTLVPWFLKTEVHAGGKPGILIAVSRFILKIITLGRNSAFNTDTTDEGEIFMGTFLGVALLEELTKVAPAAYLAYKATSKDQSMRSLVLAVAIASGFGFGVGEAFVCYSPWSGMTDFSGNVLRWFLLVPLHGTWSAISAAFVWNNVRSMQRAKTNWGILGYMVASVCLSAGLHSAHNTFAGRSFFWGITITIGTLWMLKVHALNGQASLAFNGPRALPQENSPIEFNIGAENPRDSFKQITALCFALVVVSGIFTSSTKSLSQRPPSYGQRELHRVPCSECYGAGRILGPLLGPDMKPLICPVCKGKRYELVP